MANQKNINIVQDALNADGSTLIVTDVAVTESGKVVFQGHERTRYTVTPVVARKLNVLYLDNENIFLKIQQFYQSVKSEIELTKEEKEQRDHVLAVYNERRVLIENIGKGLAPLPANKEYVPLDFVEQGNTPTGTAFFYAYSYHLRNMKDMLRNALQLEASPHGGLTTEIGVLQFSVQNVSIKEANAIAALYSDMVLSFAPPVIREGQAKKGAKVGNQRVKPVSQVRATSKPTVVIKDSERPVTGNKDAVTTRKANAKELEMLAQVQEMNKEQ